MSVLESDSSSFDSTATGVDRTLPVEFVVVVVLPLVVAVPPVPLPLVPLPPVPLPPLSTGTTGTGYVLGRLTIALVVIEKPLLHVQA